jgi:two-component system OmpR family sensor kinase
MTQPAAGPDGPSAPESRLIRRTARVLAFQIALALAVLMLAIGVIALILDETQEHRQAGNAARRAWAGPVDVAEPPTNVWFIAVRPDGERIFSPTTPVAVRRLDPRRLPDRELQLDSGGHELVVWTGDHPLGRLSAIYDLNPREAQERPLIISLALACLFGLLIATVTGAALARRAVRPLGTALALQRRFVADASHELRTPLTILTLRAQILQTHLPNSVGPPVTDELDQLIRDAQVMSEVVDDLLLTLTLARRRQAGQHVDLWTLTSEVARSLQPLADRRPVTLSTSGCRAEVSGVHGRPTALRRAITALVENAIEHTPPGGHVQLEVGTRPGQVTVSISDDGEGLDPAEAGRLVQRFAQGPSPDRGRRFGLGLALVEEVTRAHGGRLEVDGEPGRGATFTIVLPAG